MADKKAMSRALGAAFLNHQVEQLEKSAASGNWRSRNSTVTSTPMANANPHGYGRSSPKRERGMQQQPGNGNNNTNATKTAPRKKAAPAGVLVIPRDTPPPARRSIEGSEKEKDADVIVVDASVLVHALHQVKRWCRDGREEVIIVPLEALNTLDLLKKGTSALAQRARAASRILEAQVGTNPRIRVQQDDAFVPWDTITFSAPAPDASSTPTTPADGPDTSPEWVRRTVCCARWELDAASKDADKDKATKDKARTVRLVVLAPDAPPLSTADGGPLSKHEPHATGTLVAHWGARAGLTVLPIAPSTNPNPNPSTNGAASPISNSAGTGTLTRPRSGTQTKRSGGSGNGSIRAAGAGAAASSSALPPPSRWKAAPASCACLRAASVSMSARERAPCEMYIIQRRLR